MKRIKYTGEVDEHTIQFLEKHGYDASQLCLAKNGKLYVQVEEEENQHHPDDPIQSGVYEHFIN